MAKFYGSAVKTGKLGGSVFAIRYGETIERQYQPIVANPSTPAQIASRAKLKILSQLSAVMDPVIAIPRMGAVSPRNLFVRENYPAVTYTDNEANVNLTQVKLTRGVTALPQLLASRNQEGNLAVNLAGTSTALFDRVVYVVFHRNDDNSLIFDASAVVSEPGAANHYAAVIELTALNATNVVYAYGVRDNTESARIHFASMTVPTAEMVANLIVSRILTEADVTLSETRSMIVAAPNAQQSPSREADSDLNVKSKK